MDSDIMRPRGPQCFVDYRYVDGGKYSWVSGGEALDQWADDPPPDTYGYTNAPSGIRLQAQPAELVGPVIPMDKPWETQYNMYFATAMYDEGVYRAWYTCIPPDHLTRPGLRWRKSAGQVVCYAESNDGFTWRKPNLGFMRYNGEDTNIVYGREIGPYGFQSGSVYKDPHAASASERYKLFYMGEVDSEDLDALKSQYQRRFGDEMTPKAFIPGEKRNTVRVIAAAVSPDGLRWTPVLDPLMVHYSDTLNNVSWDEARGRYVGYFRLRRAGRRVVARAETADFYHWPETPDTVLEPPLDWLPSDDIYTNSKTVYPGTCDTHLMFPGVFRRFEDSRDIFLAASLDGLNWSFVPGGPVVERGALGSWSSGDLNPGIGLVPLSGDLIALPIMAYTVPHKFPRGGEGPFGTPGWATWTRGRLAALVAAERGEFSTPRLIFEGRELSLNVRTRRSGEVLVELQDDKGQPIPGFTFADADPIVADSVDRRVTWQGNANIGAYAGQKIILSFRLRSTHLYGFEFVGA